MNEIKTLLSHGKLPYPIGTLVEDTEIEDTGRLVGVLEEHSRETQQLVARRAFMRPVGGGREWEVPAERIRPVEDQS
ncbi:hypothetical protein ABT381_26620 [Streptomyces sp. NPDC000151]|uniref:hypothetical protein n=1 Tax=Streptomyces sp. NPDC000151 TaxID=3154244 RepID=UPI003317FAAD